MDPSIDHMTDTRVFRVHSGTGASHCARGRIGLRPMGFEFVLSVSSEGSTVTEAELGDADPAELLRRRVSKGLIFCGSTPIGILAFSASRELRGTCVCAPRKPRPVSRLAS